MQCIPHNASGFALDAIFVSFDITMPGHFSIGIDPYLYYIDTGMFSFSLPSAECSIYIAYFYFDWRLSLSWKHVLCIGSSFISTSGAMHIIRILPDSDGWSAGGSSSGRRKKVWFTLSTLSHFSSTRLYMSSNRPLGLMWESVQSILWNLLLLVRIGLVLTLTFFTALSSL